MFQFTNEKLQLFFKMNSPPPQFESKKSKYHKFKLFKNKNSESCLLEMNTHQIAEI